MILGTIVGIVFTALLVKAIFETIVGICLIIKGICWHAIAFILDAITFLPSTIAKRKQRKQDSELAAKRKAMISNPLIADLVRIGSYRPQQPKKETPELSGSLSVARLNMTSTICLKQP